MDILSSSATVYPENHLLRPSRRYSLNVSDLLNVSSKGNLMTVPQSITQLVQKFEEQRELYTTDLYKETQVRIEFIDPLFRALGWDVDNSKGLSLIYREVVHEDTVLVEGNKKAPDYSFRI